MGERIWHTAEWSSATDQFCSWFEAEKLLPASVTSISVRFRVITALGDKTVYKVDRPNMCAWIRDESQKYMAECIWMRSTDSTSDEPVDVTFELSGASTHCYVWRAWNAAKDYEWNADWEHWEPEDTRPCRLQQPEVLLSADLAAPSGSGIGNPASNLDVTTRRLIAAVRTLQEVRRRTIKSLRDADRECTERWFIVNGVNTLSAGLGIASAVAIFLAPPVGIGLGIASAATSGTATVAEIADENSAISQLRQTISLDAWNTLAVAELECEWLQAQDHLGECLCTSSPEQKAVTEGMVAAVKLSLSAGGGSAHSTSGVAFISNAAKVVPAAKVLGVAGAVVTTGIAIHGWSTTKELHQALRQRLAQATASMTTSEKFLAAMSSLECSICLCSVELSDQAGSCAEKWHYSHASCLHAWRSECDRNHREACCPLCNGALSDKTGLLGDLLAETVRNDLRELSS